MRKMIIWVLAVLLALSFTGCSGAGDKMQGKERFTQTYLDYFDTVITITGYEKDYADFAANCDKIEALVKDYHQLSDIYHAYDRLNNAYTLNQAAAKEPMAVDERLFALLEFGVSAYEMTDGKCNIAMGAVLSLWHEKREAALEKPDAASLPEQAALEQAAMHTDIADLVLDSSDRTVFYADEDLMLDLGAIAKGYTTQKAAELLEEMGVSGYLLNFGGNVKAVGAKPDGSCWNAGIQNPDGEGVLRQTALTTESLVTSGSYQRGFTVDGKWYHHIIDPDTLYPAEKFASVSVKCANSGIADALSTALFQMSIEQSEQILRKFDDISVMWVKEDGEIITSKESVFVK